MKKLLLLLLVNAGLTYTSQKSPKSILKKQTTLHKNKNFKKKIIFKDEINTDLPEDFYVVRSQLCQAQRTLSALDDVGSINISLCKKLYNKVYRNLNAALYADALDYYTRGPIYLSEALIKSSELLLHINNALKEASKAKQETLLNKRSG